MTEAQAWLKISKEKKLQGKINVTEYKVIFTPSQGDGGFSITGSQLKCKPLASNATAENVALKISSLQKDHVLYFQGSDAAKRREVVKEAVTKLLVSSQGVEALAVKSESKDSKSPPLTPPRPAEGDGDSGGGFKSEGGKGAVGLDDGYGATQVSKEVTEQRQLKLFQDKTNGGRLHKLLEELVKITQFMTEDAFWSYYDDTKDAMAMDPVPSTIPSIKDVVRTNSALKINLNAANIHQLHLDYPGLQQAEVEAVRSGKTPSRLHFFTAFYNYLENGPQNVEPAVKQLFKPIVESALSAAQRWLPAKEAKRRRQHCHPSVDLTAVGGVGTLYGGPDGIGLATGPLTRKRRRMAREAGGKDDAGAVVDRVNRHQFSIVETLVPWTEDEREGRTKVEGADGGREGERNREKVIINREGLGHRDPRGGGLDIDPPHLYQRLPLKAPWDLAGGSKSKGQEGGVRLSVSKGECAEEWSRWHLAHARQRVGGAEGRAVVEELETVLGPVQHTDKSQQSEQEQAELRSRLFIVNGLLRHHWANATNKSSDKERLKRLQDRLDRLAAHCTKTLSTMAQDKSNPSYQLTEHTLDVISSIKRVS